MDAQCSERTWPAHGGFHGVPCRNKAKVERNGISYCGVHDPAKIEAKREAKVAKWAAEEAAKQNMKRSAEALAIRLGVGRPAWSNGTTGFYYTGGLTLSADNAEQLLRELGR